MGRAAKANPRSVQGKTGTARELASLSRLLNRFADRASFEQWCAARKFGPALVRYLEASLPLRLKAQEPACPTN